MAAPDGQASTRVQYDGTGASGAARLYQTPTTITTGGNSCAAMWIRSRSGNLSLRISDNTTVSDISVTETWQQVSAESVLPNAPRTVGCVLYAASGSNAAFDIEVCHAQLTTTSGIAPYVATGSVAVNEGAPRGLAA